MNVSNQVHQTKKSNKWECKLCGEKQSMKRHYGLGTGKECRFHVQKLNGIRRKLDEINNTSEQNDTSDEEVAVQDDTKVQTKPNQTNFESKWSEFIDETKDSQVLEPTKSMYLGNAEVVLELPAKRRKLTKPKNASDSNTYPTKTDDYNNFGKIRLSPSPPSIRFYETQLSKVQKNLPEINVVKANEDQIIEAKQTEITVIKPFVPHKVGKKSKWVQFADESDGDNRKDDRSLCNDENGSVTDDVNNDEKSENILNNMPDKATNIFSQCDDNYLDDILDL